MATGSLFTEGLIPPVTQTSALLKQCEIVLTQNKAKSSKEIGKAFHIEGQSQTDGGQIPIIHSKQKQPSGQAKCFIKNKTI